MDLCWRKVSSPAPRLERWDAGQDISSCQHRINECFRNGLTSAGYGCGGLGWLLSPFSPHQAPAASKCRICTDCDLVTQATLTPGSLSSIQAGQIMFSL